MTDLADLRAGLTVNLGAIPNMQVSPYLLSSPTPPTIEIAPGETTYDLASHRGLDHWRIVVRAFVGYTSDIGAQQHLDRMLAGSGPDSIKEAVESDPTLGGKVDDLRVVSCSGYRGYVRESGGPVLGAEWQVDIYAAG